MPELLAGIAAFLLIVGLCYVMTCLSARRKQRTAKQTAQDALLREYEPVKGKAAVEERKAMERYLKAKHPRKTRREVKAMARHLQHEFRRKSAMVKGEA